MSLATSGAACQAARGRSAPLVVEFGRRTLLKRVRELLVSLLVLLVQEVEPAGVVVERDTL